MSDISSVTVDQPPLRNANHQRQNGHGRGRQMIQLLNMRPPPPTTTHRILVIQNQADIVGVLSSISWNYRQAIYILSERGYVSQATLLSLPSKKQQICLGHGEILYLSGWFHPMNPNGQNANGILHVSLSSVQGGVGLASALYASGSVELEVVFVCGPGSTVQPDALGGPREPIRIAVIVPAPRAPVAQ